MKRRKVAGLLAVFILSAATMVSGCTKGASEEKTEEQNPPAKAEASETEEEGTEEASEEMEIDPEVMDIAKYNIYVEMNNSIVEVLNNLDAYYMVVEYADEFALIPDSGYDYKFDISYLNTDIIDDALLVADMEPAYDTLDDLTKKVAVPMRNLIDTFNQISDSYDFADNEYEKAKEYHTQIQENVDAFNQLSGEFMEEINIIGNERVAAEEQKMLEEGRLIIYNSSHAITVAQQIIDECMAQGVDDSNITELDLTNIKPLYEELKATVEAYNEAVSDSEQIMKESLSNSAPFDGLLDSLVQSVEFMINQVESGTPIEDPGRDYLGGMVHIQYVLSDCIERYNTVFTE